MKLLDKLAYKVLRKKSNEEIKKIFDIKCGCKKPIIRKQEVKINTLQSTTRIDKHDMRVIKDYQNSIRKEIAYDLIDNIKDLIEIDILEDNNTYRIYKGTLKCVKR